MEITREQVIEYLSGLPVIEMAALVKELEDKWGVSAAPAPQVQQIVPEEQVEEQTEFNVILTSFGDKKINVIKTVRAQIPGLGLKEAKELVEGTPATIKEGITKEEAEELAKLLREAGAEIEIK